MKTIATHTHTQCSLFVLMITQLPIFSLPQPTCPNYFNLTLGLLYLPSARHPSVMAESTQGWWKLTFLRRKKSQPKVLYEIPAEFASNSTAGQHGSTAANAATACSEDTAQDPQLDARLERIVDKTTASKGRHVKVSHSGRFKEKKRVRATLAENPDIFPGDDRMRDENQRAGKWPDTETL